MRKRVNRLRRLPYFVALAGVLLFHGCATTYRIVEFEVLEPATVSLPEHVQNLLILNRAPLTTQVFEEDDIRGINDSQLRVLDTLIINNMFRGLLRMFKQSPIERFNRPVFIEQRRDDTLGMKNFMLSSREVDDLCRTNGGDAIICLEHYGYDLRERIIAYEDAPSMIAAKFYESASRVHWNIYIPGYPSSFDSYSLEDTLYFTDVADGTRVQYSTPAKMVSETFYASGSHYGSYLVPEWSHTIRPLFKSGDPALRKAVGQTNLGDWDSAYVLWQQLAEGVDSTLRCKALHNMAVYYELEDNLDSASMLVNAALLSDTLAVVREYKEELDVRVQNRRELNKQVR